MSKTGAKNHQGSSGSSLQQDEAGLVRDLQERNRILEAKLAERTRQLEEMQALFQGLVPIDPLTGVRNRREFFNLAEYEYTRSIREHRPFCILMLDIDNFRVINEKLGHSQGDEVLRLVTRACIASLRLSDIVGRIGGDEFIIFLPETFFEDGLLIAERLRKSIEMLEARGEDGMPLAVTATLGFACQKGLQYSLEQVIEIAEQALKHGKQLGQNQVVFPEDMENNSQ